MPLNLQPANSHPRYMHPSMAAMTARGKRHRPAGPAASRKKPRYVATHFPGTGCRALRSSKGLAVGSNGGSARLLTICKHACMISPRQTESRSDLPITHHHPRSSVQIHAGMRLSRVLDLGSEGVPLPPFSDRGLSICQITMMWIENGCCSPAVLPPPDQSSMAQRLRLMSYG